MTDYRAQLQKQRDRYPFKRWQARGLERYTPETCDAFAAVMDGLLADLEVLGLAAPEAMKLKAFEKAVRALNDLNRVGDSLIETGEREALCDLVYLIAIAAGLDPTAYGGGEGPASEWREW